MKLSWPDIKFPPINLWSAPVASKQSNPLHWDLPPNYVDPEREKRAREVQRGLGITDFPSVEEYKASQKIDAEMQQFDSEKHAEQFGIDDTLKERGNRYGDFGSHAQITQDLKAVMQACPSWAALSADKKEGLEMIMHKVGRILNGDPEYHDSWHDIVGYSKLVADRLLKG
jgi:hypothetical protein